MAITFKSLHMNGQDDWCIYGDGVFIPRTRTLPVTSWTPYYFHPRMTSVTPHHSWPGTHGRRRCSHRALPSTSSPLPYRERGMSSANPTMSSTNPTMSSANPTMSSTSPTMSSTSPTMSCEPIYWTFYTEVCIHHRGLVMHIYVVLLWLPGTAVVEAVEARCRLHVSITVVAMVTSTCLEQVNRLHMSVPLMYVQVCTGVSLHGWLPL